MHGAYPFEKVSLDITGPLPKGTHGEKYILGIIDNFSKYPALIPLKNSTAEQVAKAMYARIRTGLQCSECQRLYTQIVELNLRIN